jgi:DNA-binding CsgD family transcriptional regulator
VAVALAAGDGLAAVAAAHGVSLATVRTQAQHVYRKTGVRGRRPSRASWSASHRCADVR